MTATVFLTVTISTAVEVRVPDDASGDAIRDEVTHARIKDAMRFDGCEIESYTIDNIEEECVAVD